VFRAEVIGSLLRPSYLKEARAAFERGELSAHDFKRVEDRAVDQVIAMQEGSGAEVVPDGEMRRYLFMGPITETVEGIEAGRRPTRCGFASVAEGNPISEEVEEHKLRLVADVAHAAWG
jgi:methionine synthase II (cobalamin-independent)